MARILVIEDDANLAAGLEYNLRKNGHDVSLAANGQEGLERARDENPDLIVLDLMLPKMSGIEVLEALKVEGLEVPVLILSAKDDEMDKIRGFDAGAVDYVTKPFGLGELLARIRVRLGERAQKTEEVRLGGGVLRLDRYEFERDGEKVSLTQTEVDVLTHLLDAPGKPVTREELLRAIWGLGPNSTRTLDTHMARLRKKIEPHPASPKCLVTVHGVGYRLTLD